MNELKLSPDDPKLTAYALGELEGVERARIEYALGDDPAAQAVVAHIQAMAAELETALEAEPAAAVAPTRLEADPYGPTGRRKMQRAPKIIYIFGGLAAACFAVVLALQEPAVRQAPVKTYHEITMPTLELPAAETEIVEAISGEASHEEAAVVTFPFLESDVLAGGLVEQATRSFQSAHNGSESTTGRGPLPTAEPRPFSTAPVLSFGSPQATLPEMWSQQRLRSARATVATGAAVMRASFQEPGLRAPNPTAGEARAYATYRFSPQFLTPPSAPSPRLQFNAERYAYRGESEFVAVERHPVSTFSADVDTASYSNIRRFIASGTLPPADAVRIEELLNYFPYRYAAPTGRTLEGHDAPFAASMEVADAPWAAGHRLVRIGLKAREIAMAERGAANLVFLLDVSGSMNAPNKLPLVQESLRLLMGRLRADDRVAIVTYAGASGLALPSTPVANAREIIAALDDLLPGGSTNGALGIQLAYDIAKANFVRGGINRVILCTDGDFNVGVTDEGGLVRLIEEKAKSGVFLTVLGFGMGNLNDSTMQQIADRGNGTYGYVDSRREAEKLLVQQVSGTLVTVAKDVKLQVEFNPAVVASYRLIGYEKRLLKDEDFNNDTVDAGEVGAGHTVTALYEIVPVGVSNRLSDALDHPVVDELKYAVSRPVKSGDFAATAANQNKRDEGVASPVETSASSELLTLKVRYKEPTGDVSKKLEFPLVDQGSEFADASDDFKFAAAVAGFGMILRDSPSKGLATLSSVRAWAEAGSAYDTGGYRKEFIDLVRRAETLQ